MAQDGISVHLKPFVRPGLDVLFVGLNPSRQSNANGHYFSGAQSRFFHLLGLSGLTTQMVPKATADEIVFGGTSANVGGAAYGIVDLVDHLVETDSTRVRPTAAEVDRLIDRIVDNQPRHTCIIHSKVVAALDRWGGLTKPLTYGYCGQVLPNSTTEFVVNYFPNGNSVPDGVKLSIFIDLRKRLGVES